MPAIAVAAGRQTATAVVSAGLADVNVPLVDHDDVATTVVPAVGQHLVLAFCNVANDGDNNNGAEVRCDFGATTYARGGSSMRYSTFGSNVSRGSQLASAFTVTGDGSTALTLVGRGLSGGASAQCSSGNIQAIPTSELGDFQAQESANSDAAITTPVTGWTAVGTDLTFDPSDDGDYVLIASVELFADGTDTNADEVAIRCRFGADGAPATVQQETYHERDTNFPAGEIRRSYRWEIERPLLSGTTYRLSVEANGTDANGNFPARRVRFFAFRSDSVSVYRGLSTGGIDETAATGPFALPGLSIAVDDPVESDIVHAYLGQTEAQTTQFADFRLVQGANAHPPNGTFRGVDDNDTGAANDITLIPVQSSEVLAAGSAYTVTGELVTYGSGNFAVGMLRGGASFVPAEFLVIAWQTPAAGTPLDITDDVQGSGAVSDVVRLAVPLGVVDSVQAAATESTVVRLLVGVEDEYSPGGMGFADVGDPPVAPTVGVADDVQGEASVVDAVRLAIALPVADSVQASATVADTVSLDEVALVVDAVQAEATVADVLALSTAIVDAVQVAASITDAIGGLALVVLTGHIATSRTTRRLVTQQGTRMGQPWYVNPEDEGQTLSERIVYPEETVRNVVTVAAAPVDLTGVVGVALEVWDPGSTVVGEERVASWILIAGTGSSSTETGADSNGVEQTWHVLAFSPDVGSLQALADIVGRGAKKRRWVLDLGGGRDQRVPSSGYDQLVLNALP